MNSYQKKLGFVSLIAICLFLTSCSSNPVVSEDSALLEIACTEVDAYNDLLDAGDESSANSHWQRVRQIQSQLNQTRSEGEQISDYDWSFICSQ